jgi:ABC-2 type transport system ATP-binding protein
MSTTENYVISTQGLSKSYHGVEALKPLYLQVPEKSIFGFLGPNGAGKTTTIKLLLGLTRPTTGGGTIFGKDIIKDSVAIRINVGYLPQDARFYEHLTARETLRFTARFFFKGPSAEIEKRIDEMLDLVGLTDKADRPIKGFSGGERQRLGIAQAEINYPDLLILDEPAASLDPMGRRDVLNVMDRLRKYATVFYCTHILDDVQRVSDSVAILNRGQLVTQASIEELLADAGGVVYSVKLKGDVEDAHGRVSAQPWVSEIQVSRRREETRWQVSVTDPRAAEEGLLNLLLAGGGVQVTDFGVKETDLEDVFLNLIEGTRPATPEGGSVEGGKK